MTQTGLVLEVFWKWNQRNESEMWSAVTRGDYNWVLSVFDFVMTLVDCWSLLCWQQSFVHFWGEFEIQLNLEKMNGLGVAS